MNKEQADYRLLQDINSVVRQFGKSLTDYNLPHLDEIPPAENIYVAMEVKRASQLRGQLTDEQTALANAVIEAVVNVANNAAQNNRLFYLEGAGGGFQVGTDAFTGIPATLLKKGTTNHRLFRLPVSIVENSGDFSQLVHVVRKGKPTEIVDMCLKSSPSWHLVKEFRLLRNMRTRPVEQQLAAWLRQLGKGVLPVREQEPFPGAIKVPSQCVIQYEFIVDTLFRDLLPEIMASSVVLTPTNDDSLIINDNMLALLLGEEKKHKHKGLYNGTRLIVRYLHDNCVDAEVLTGNAIGDRVLIPRV
ncbi:uncharacterized protein LOC130628677 [Hydractinia symbiolongicarpus]|uniref:uncharacterized protein LOC130628677 n=1 Tax=Hydractinia symbiolongicarpus TaxID=13093 RepID=UPI00254DF42F|nr:uncharacterized protein LOC130628677 [Hydractinia symbiolongicarpus]